MGLAVFRQASGTVDVSIHNCECARLDLTIDAGEILADDAEENRVKPPAPQVFVPTLATWLAALRRPALSAPAQDLNEHSTRTTQ
jgi:hypothetical protein